MILIHSIHAVHVILVQVFNKQYKQNIVTTLLLHKSGLSYPILAVSVDILHFVPKRKVYCSILSARLMWSSVMNYGKMLVKKVGVSETLKAHSCTDALKAVALWADLNMLMSTDNVQFILYSLFLKPPCFHFTQFLHVVFLRGFGSFCFTVCKHILILDITNEVFL